MRVDALMRKRVQTVREDGSAEQALKRMRAGNLRHLVVLRGRRVVGMLSDRDLTAILVGGVRVDRTIDQVMRRDVVGIAPGDTVEQAARRMRLRKIGALPVIDGDELVGILTVSDLLDLIVRGPIVRKSPKTRGRSGRAGPRPSECRRARLRR
jgi:acetoin utilization protein AcuB